jgi:pyruvate/2-oxoglutarate dehydrogenase complex dihydrolipoamide dehydrogenase (E3) component
VTLLEVAERVIPGEDPEVSAALAGELEGNGIHVVAGIEGVEEIRRGSGGLELTYRLEGAARAVTVDAVILAVGWPAAIADIGLESAGVRTERGYVAVDDTLRTSVPHIWAAGDVTGRTMLVQSATYEGRIAAENALDGGARRLHHAIVAHGGFTDPEYGSVGLTEPVARERGEVVIGRVDYADLDRAVIDGRTEGFCKLVVDAASHRLLGAHVIGEQAAEVVQVAAAAMAAGMPVERLAEVEFAYPTFTSIVALAARQVVHALRLGDDAAAWEATGRPRQSEWERREA